MKKILFNQTEIAKRSGVSQQQISYVLRGDRVPSQKTALALENATGVCREAWLWPERHYNPYMDFHDAIQCTSCPYVLQRGQRLCEIYTKYCEDVSDVVAILERVINPPPWYCFIVCQQVEEGWKLLANMNAPGFWGILANEILPDVVKSVGEDDVLVVPSISAMNKPNREFFENHNIVSFSMARYKDIILADYTVERPMAFYPEHEVIWRKFVRLLYDIAHGLHKKEGS